MDAGIELTQIQQKSLWVEAWIAVQPLVLQEQGRDQVGYTEAETPHFPLFTGIILDCVLCYDGNLTVKNLL